MRILDLNLSRTKPKKLLRKPQMITKPIPEKQKVLMLRKSSALMTTLVNAEEIVNARTPMPRRTASPTASSAPAPWSPPVSTGIPMGSAMSGSSTGPVSMAIIAGTGIPLILPATLPTLIIF